MSTYHRASVAHRTHRLSLGPPMPLGHPQQGSSKLTDSSSASTEAILLSLGSGASAYLQEKRVWKVAVFPVVKKDHV